MKFLCVCLYARVDYKCSKIMEHVVKGHLTGCGLHRHLSIFNMSVVCLVSYHS